MNFYLTYTIPRFGIHSCLSNADFYNIKILFFELNQNTKNKTIVSYYIVRKILPNYYFNLLAIKLFFFKDTVLKI